MHTSNTNNILDSVYGAVFAYCKQRGLIEQLERSFSVFEYEAMDALNIEQDGLNILDAVHCVYDKNRTYFFLRELGEVVKPGDTVVEAGIGTGILSFCAAALGAVVYGCEINSSIFALAEDIRKTLEEQKIIPEGSVRFFLCDATTFTPPQKADVLISENIYTGMFFEKQVPIVKHLVKYLKKDGIVVPERMLSRLVLCQIKYDKKQYGRQDLVIPSRERGFVVPSVELSQHHLFNTIDFKNVEGLGVSFAKDIPILRDGMFNAIMMYSDVYLSAGTVIHKEDTDFLNSEIYLVIDPAISLQTGNSLSVSIAYDYGGKPKDASVQIK